jgi:protoporphyrinogen IX oxidase
MAYFWFKSFHIVAFVAWFAGLFYLPRLFVYHVEANEQPEPARTILQQQYQLMEKRLYGIITTPAMIVTIAMAIGMLVINPDLLHETWLHIKLGFVVLLIGYHHYCARLMKQMAAGTFKWSGQQLRGFNEVSTVLLVLIVMLAIFKNNFPTSAAAWSIFAMILSMVAAIQLYARKRRLDQERKVAEAASLNGAASEAQAG